jgi:hypothetical protein
MRTSNHTAALNISEELYAASILCSFQCAAKPEMNGRWSCPLISNRMCIHGYGEMHSYCIGPCGICPKAIRIGDE